jgi:phosphate transport system substrate-binding protein
MIFGFNGNARMKALAGALVLGMAAVASAAQAGTTLVGGGATLPALGYGGDVSLRQITPTAGSFLAVYSAQTGNPQVSYCQTGSGAGKNILANATVAGVTYNVQNSCDGAAVGTPTPTGFGAPAVDRSDLARANFAGADAPLSLSDYTNYTAGTSTSTPVQFPVIAGSIAIAYNNADLATLDLSDSQVCQIFNGTITDWSQISSATSGPITVVYRSDGSGTTFGFSNHLTQVCGSVGTKHFQADQAFTNVDALFGLPAGSVGQSGNPAVADYVANHPGSIAYVESANAISVLGQYATVNGLDPLANFGGSAVTINSSDVVYNQAINGFDGTTGRPVLSAISGAPSNQCIALVKPDAYATQPAGTYPIVAVSYFLANSANNGSDRSAVQNLMWAPYNPTITHNAGTTGPVSTVGPNTGLSFLSTSFTQTQVQGCVGA